MKNSEQDAFGSELEKSAFYCGESGKVFLMKDKELRIQSVRTIFLFLTLVFIFFYIEWISGLSGEELVVDIFFGVSILMLVVLVLVYRSMRGIQLRICIYQDRLEYPMFHFWRRILPLSDIFSSERIVLHGSLVAAVVGKINGSMVVFEKNKFANGSDFLEFESIISCIAKENFKKTNPSKKLYINSNKFYSYIIQLNLSLLFIALLTYRYVEGAVKYSSFLESGALIKTVNQGEEVYRLLSMFFLHFDLIHLTSNLLVFGLMSESLMRLVDSFRFLTILFLSALAGSLVSLFLSPHEYVIGASGGIFGLFGAYCVVKFTKNLPGTVSQRSNRMVLAVIVIQVATEYFIGGIDSYSHVGGFTAGALCMAVYLHFSKAQSIYKSTKVEKGFAVVLTGAYLWGLLTFLSKVYV